jgi:RNA polymerase sigma-70 factor (ECF subfamily)
VPDQAQIAQLTAELAWLRRLTRALLDDARGPDLAHETWLVAAEHAPDDARPLRPWLVRVARNLARMGHRADVRRTRREISTSDDVAPVPTPEALVARAEAQRAVVDAVLALAEPHRSIVLLRYFEELTSNEIAQRLGVPSGTVRRQLKDALDRLRSQLGADREVRKRALAPLLLPLAGARPIPISVGVIAMKKIVAVVVALAVAVVATVWWRRSGSTPPESVATSASSAGNAPRRSAIGSASTAGWFAPHEIGDRSIAGRVVFDDQPVASATVTLIAFTQHRGKLTRELRTDADGHFDFGALSPTDATYEVTASAPGRSPAVVWVHLSDPTVKPPPDQLVRARSLWHGVRCVRHRPSRRPRLARR